MTTFRFSGWRRRRGPSRRRHDAEQVVRSCPGRVKGRGRASVRFPELRPADGDEHYAIRTRPWTAVAPATKKKDALTMACRPRVAPQPIAADVPREMVIRWQEDD